MDVGFVVRVVNETWEFEVAENAVDGMPSSAASHAAPLGKQNQSHASRPMETMNAYTVPEPVIPDPRFAVVC